MAELGRIIAIDIETTTEVAGVPDDAVPGLDPRYGAVTDVALVVVEADGTRTAEVISVGARQPEAVYVPGRGTVLQTPAAKQTVDIDGYARAESTIVATECQLLRSLVYTLDRLSRPDTTVVGWNSSVFDLPYLSDRMTTNQVASPFTLTPDPDVYVKYAPLPGHAGGYRATVAGMAHLDIHVPFKAWVEARDVKYSLKPAAIAAGLAPVEVDRERMHLLSLAERVVYVLSDADVTATLTLDLADELGLAAHIDGRA